ncbi:hypothetical protein [Vibrio pomeroyi]|uniref:hypothetical protein n=1 Tax=Vibrio pomeroyi TaxID=198832 RepID=UPI0035A68651
MDVIIQGPMTHANNYEYLNFIRDICESSHINKVIISTTDNDVLGYSNKKIIYSRYYDPGQDKGPYKKPLNLKRFFHGISNAKASVTSDMVLIIRSDIIVNIDKVLRLTVRQTGTVYVTDVTTKSQFINNKWIDHFCDWLYLIDNNLMNNLFVNYDYDDQTTGLKIESGSIYPLSPEKYMKKKIDQVGDVIYKLLPSSSIDLSCLKEEYRLIPFGINKKYMTSQFEFNYFRRFSKVRYIRFFLIPIFKIYYNAFRKHKEF